MILAVFAIPEDAIAACVGLLGVLVAVLIREAVKARERLARLEEWQRLRNGRSRQP